MQPVVIFLFLLHSYSSLLDLRVNPVSSIFYFYLQATVAIAKLGSSLAACTVEDAVEEKRNPPHS